MDPHHSCVGGFMEEWRRENLYEERNCNARGCAKVVGLGVFSFILFVGSFVLFSLYNDSSSL